MNMPMIKLMDTTILRCTLMTVIYLYFLLSDAVNYVNCTKQKRQLFREQVLPVKGGKIPDSTFHPERLLLNRLNQQGISIPDGVILQQRRPEKHPFPKQNLPETLQIVLTNDGRYIAPPGRYHYDKAPTVDTTYVIRIPHKTFYKSTTLPQWTLAVQVPPVVDYYKQVDVTKWISPILYNEISFSMSPNKKKEDMDPSEVLAEYSSYLQKLHRDYD